MKVTIKEVVPTPPPKIYVLELSEAELATLRYFAGLLAHHGAAHADNAAARRFNNIVPKVAAWDPEVCFQEVK